ncbi:S-layer homology domain-containing protein [Sporosarcina oncorhynchi]|uniref:S-layer homology domain-containing protein n=1 Tax=Sporosarcina oncorhynchi TaxID=3056444 RepID=A0ABZ0L6D7_9BACL|nr:S-layer homology domain-containing protein [Sporosarcina sp. T2O-4]WOV88058.1 S-layer homology domain-containing protein [Sporosarcina sp. T2O-4]
MKKYSRSYQKLFRAVLASGVAGGALVAASPIFVQANDSGPALFNDVNPNAHYFEPVMNLSARGIVKGYEDSTYKPNNSVTRGQAAKILALALGLDTVNVKNPGFVDVKETDSYYGPISALVQAGIINGYDDKTFKPNDNLKRSQMAKIITLGFGLEQETLTDNRFADIRTDDVYASYVQALLSNNITTGNTPTTFGPNALVTRGQIATFIFRSEMAVSLNGFSSQIVNINNDTIELTDGSYKLQEEMKALFNPSNLSVLKDANITLTADDGLIGKISSIVIKASGDAKNHLTLDGKESTLTGNLIINGDFVSVKNLIVEGNLEIGSQVKSSFQSDNITVKGKTIISDKNSSTKNAQADQDKVYRSIAFLKPVIVAATDATGPVITFSNSTMGTVEVSKKNVKIQALGKTNVQAFVISSNAQLKAEAGVTIPKITISEGVTAITIDAPVTSLTINTKSALKLESTGKIGEVTIGNNSSKISFGTNTKIGNLILPKGTEAKDVIQDYDKVKANIENIGGETNPEAKPTTPAPPATIGSGGGGGNSGGNTGGGNDGSVQQPEAPQSVTLAPDSLGVAGDEKITGLTSGRQYVVIVDGEAKGVKADGSLGTHNSPAEFLAGTEIRGLTNTKTYKVEQVMEFIDYQPIGEVTDISSEVRFNKGENKFVVPAGKMDFTFTDSSYQIAATYSYGEWTFATGLIPVVPGTPVTPDTVTVDYVTTKTIIALTEGVTFVEGKFTVPANLSTFEFREDGILVNGAFNGIEWEYTAIVDGESQLIVALLNDVYSNIKLAADIEGLKKNIIVNRPVTINGNTHKLTFTAELNGLNNSERQGILVTAANVKISGVTVKMANSDGWQSLYAIQVYNAKNVTLHNITATNADGGILVNGSEVVLTGTITVSDNEFGGIEVSKGEGLTTGSVLNVEGTLVNDSEKYGQPTVWVENGQGEVTGLDLNQYIESKFIKDGQTQYYQKAENTIKSIDVDSLDKLEEALKDNSYSVINLTKDIEGLKKNIIVNRPVTINGNTHKLSFTAELNGLNNSERQGILVTAANVKISGVTVEMANSDGWQSLYAIQVYNAKNVTLHNITATNADGGILVNGSEVVLTGTITVSDNEFGGIEVSKGEGLTTGSVLNVEGTLVNDSEKYGQPTVWVENGQGEVTGLDLNQYIESKFIKDGQTQYYQKAENTIKSIDVDSLDKLEEALKDNSYSVINLTKDIEGLKKNIIVNRPVTINGNTHKLSFTAELNGLNNSERQGILVTAANVKISGVTVEMANSDGWQSLYAIQVYNAKNVTLHNITATNADGGILVNGSEVVLTGTITVSDNEFGGIEVSKGEGLTTGSVLNVEGTLVNDSEKYGQPTVWVENGQGEVTGLDLNQYIESKFIKDGQTQYYQKAENTIKSIDVDSLDKLEEALKDNSYSVINLTKDIEGLKKNIIVNRPVTINGNTHKLSFTAELNGLNNSERQGILVTAANVKISGVTVEMANSDGWQSLYAIQVYNAKNVTLHNITATNADGGILVNGSEVVLTGTITVSDNEFGGIEVSKGEGLTTGSVLNVEGTLVNNSEKYGQPTVWVENGQGEVTGLDLNQYIESKFIKEGQTQYYQKVENAKVQEMHETNLPTLDD